MRFEMRPLGPWIGPTTGDRASHYRFKAAWSDTLDLLGRETERLGAHLVVLQVDVTEGEVRRDGMLRANARVGFPGVRVSFDSRHGPLTYATDAYDSWRANVRAVALSLEALRAVDRYGVSRTGEQYRGWTAIDVGPSVVMSLDEAARLLAAGTDGRFTAEQLLVDKSAVGVAYKLAVRALHPDVGGDPEMFRRVTAARDLLERSPL